MPRRGQMSTHDAVCMLQKDCREILPWFCETMQSPVKTINQLQYLAKAKDEKWWYRKVGWSLAEWRRFLLSGRERLNAEAEQR